MKYYYEFETPCKINLNLNILNKREDGYHNLCSIFQMVSLSDTIKAKLNSNGLINIEGDFDCSTENNLIYKATKKFMSKINCTDGVSYKVNKNIPSGGGIGGGSGNSAGVIKFLNYFYGNPLNECELFNLGLELGSDVPFFLGSGTGLVEGRGEIITPLKTDYSYYILLVNPSIHISTKEAFAKLRKNTEKNCFSEQNRADLINNYLKGVDFFQYFKNSFEIELFSEYNFINEIKMVMLSGGASHASLSGSGSTMFGVFKDYERALNVENILSKNHSYNTYIVKPIGEFPNISEIS